VARCRCWLIVLPQAAWGGAVQGCFLFFFLPLLAGQDLKSWAFSRQHFTHCILKLPPPFLTRRRTSSTPILGDVLDTFFFP